jgi:hypothetical protein
MFASDAISYRYLKQRTASATRVLLKANQTRRATLPEARH